MKTFPFAIVVLALSGCGGAPAPEPKTVEAPAPSPAASAAPSAPAPTIAAHTSGDAPEISRSTGSAGGVVVLWPRVIGDKGGALESETRQIAARIQRRLSAMVARALPGRPVDVRPEPERVCPRSGCAATAVGAVLSRSGGGCAVAALVSEPGTSAARILPWAGKITLRHPTVPFRQPPEQEMSVDDYQNCGALDGDLAAHEAEVEAALKKGG
jgi:hypothetical protein